MPTVALLESLRPHQWVKNALVLAPLVFAHRVGDRDSMIHAFVAVAIFCALSSSIYLVNDIVDREADAQHPVKSRRPIASGRVSPALAGIVCVGLAVFAGVGSAMLTGWNPNPEHTAFWIWPFAYASLNLAYSFALKRQVIIDCLCIALGFQFRVQAGGAAIDVETSKWLLLCTFFFALFLAFCKRREELARSGNESTRSTMRHYTLPFLDQLIAPLAALSILTYALYTVDARTVAAHGTTGLMYTVPFVVFGVFRYVFLVHTRGGGEDPAALLFRDKQILLSGVLWGIAVAVILGNAG